MSRFSKQSLTLEGPAGSLEAVFEAPATTSGIAVCCHPHPLHGGRLSNKVTHTLARAFVAMGCAALRFNFRGVGKSTGRYAEGVGETDDVLAAANWARRQHPGGPLFFAGFSFGAAVALRALQTEAADGLVTVAPPVERIELPTTPPPCPWLVVQGDADELVAVNSVVDWLNELPPGPELAVLTDADHFFHGRLIELREIVVDFFGRHFPEQLVGADGA